MKLKQIAVTVIFVFAAGLNFSNAFGHNRVSLLDRSDEAVLAAPVTEFRIELDRMKTPAPFAAKPSGDDSESVVAPELDDLAAALQKAGAVDAGDIVSNYLAQRQELNTSPAPKIHPPEGLPVEFVDYLEGAIAWRTNAEDERAVARTPWERILNRPPDERRFKSTWAAFMLGRSWADDDPDKAIAYFEKVRALAQDGFADSQGLAAASLGWQARVHLNRGDYQRAMELYLQQYSAGDPSAYASLCFTLRGLMRDGTNAFATLATNSLTRRMLTAYIVSTMALQQSLAEVPDPTAVVSEWLEAVETADVTDTETIEELALAAYQNGQWETAHTWIDRAMASPTARWLGAKLLMRDGKTDRAEKLLIKVLDDFPTDIANEGHPGSPLEHNLTIDGIPAGRQIRGELGVLRLSRDDFNGALHWLLVGRFWLDSGYVAERLLTLDELKAYIDGKSGADALLIDSVNWLLARRLTRSLRGNEAREYYPSAWQPSFDALAHALTEGWNETLPDAERASALFTAAQITRTNGMELLGTEVAPDWFIDDGNEEGELTANARTGQEFTLFPASPEEQRRYARHKPDPDERFHYRYQAAFLGWEAAKLLPDNSDETARVLCISGSWLKNRDPQTADLFYKALVRRCRKTALGEEADAIRWFPQLDEEGNVIPRARRTRPSIESDEVPSEPIQTDNGGSEMSGVSPENDPPESEPSTETYIVRAGDSLARIAWSLHQEGKAVSIRKIVDANPDLEPQRLRIGQKILIPVADAGQ